MLTIRLTRKGKKNQPFFRVVVIDKRRSSIGGRAVEDLGYKNPLTKKVSLKKERILYWISKGAKPSATIHNLLVTEKIIDAKKIVKKSKKPAASATPATPVVAPAAAAATPASPAKISPEQNLGGQAPAAATSDVAQTPVPAEAPKDEAKPAEIAPTGPEKDLPSPSQVSQSEISEGKPTEPAQSPGGSSASAEGGAASSGNEAGKEPKSVQ